MQQHLKKKRAIKPLQKDKNHRRSVLGLFLPTYRKALCDRNLYVEEEDPGSESCADFDGLLGIAEHAAHTAGNQVCNARKAGLTRTKGVVCFTSS